MDTRLAPEQTDTAIQCVVSDARAHKVPALWWIVPSTQPAGLGERLQEYGFNIDDDDPGMAVELERLNDTLPEIEGFSIRAAHNDSARKQWSVTMQIGFEIPSPGDLRIKAWWNLLRKTDPDMMLAFTGFLDDQPVATSLLFLGAGVAGIYAVATIPEARRKGIGAWMTMHPLLQARARGYKTGVLFASPMGLGVYRSLGFQEYCKISSYRWVPD
jgi:GNAT superfamily N-acetyltransferase